MDNGDDNSVTGSIGLLPSWPKQIYSNTLNVAKMLLRTYLYFQLRILILDFQLLVCGCLRYVSVGRFLYSPDIKKPQQLGGGLESWRGFYQSIRLIQMGLSLNIGGYSFNPLGCFVFIEMLLHCNLSPKFNILHFFPLLLMIQTCHRLRSLNHSLSLILLLRF